MGRTFQDLVLCYVQALRAPEMPDRRSKIKAIREDVTYTERGEHIRLISVRRAEKHEQDDYYRENSV